MKRIATLMVSMVCVAAMTMAALDAREKKTSHTTKEVMKHIKEGLVKTVVEGTGTDEDIQLLLELAKSLPSNKPPKGDAKSWRLKTRALIKAVMAVQADRPNAIEQLVKVSNCTGCHTPHKVYPPKAK